MKSRSEREDESLAEVERHRASGVSSWTVREFESLGLARYQDREDLIAAHGLARSIDLRQWAGAENAEFRTAIKTLRVATSRAWAAICRATPNP